MLYCAVFKGTKPGISFIRDTDNLSYSIEEGKRRILLENGYRAKDFLCWIEVESENQTWWLNQKIKEAIGIDKDFCLEQEVFMKKTFKKAG